MNDLIKRLENLKSEILNLKSHLNLSQKEQRVLELEEQMQQSDFWADNLHAQKVAQEYNQLKKFYDFWQNLEKQTSETLELAKSANAKDADDFKKLVEDLENQYKQNRFVALLSKKYDDHNAIFSVHSGAGGVDAQDFFTLQDNYATPVEPSNTMTFSKYGITAFQVQGWNGTAWITLGSVSGNNLVKRTVSFASFATDRIRVQVTGALASYSRITEIEAWTAASAATSSTNFALASNGGTAFASSTNGPGFMPATLIDNHRSGAGWGSGGGWNDATPGTFPDWVEIDFNGQKTIDSAVVYSVQDDYVNPVEPTDSMLFTLRGITDFLVQGFDGTNWVTLSTVAGNNLVKRRVAFAPFATNRIRIYVTGALASWSRITEVEAWGN